MKRHHLEHWRGTGRSQAARRGMTSTVRSDDQFVSTNPIQSANTLFCLAAWGLFEGALRNGFIHVGLPLQNHRHTGFGLASSWWWGEAAVSRTLHLTNSWISHHLGLQEDLDEEELTSDSDCRFQMSIFWLFICSASSSWSYDVPLYVQKEQLLFDTTVAPNQYNAINATQCNSSN